ncbi:MAG: hypothetical protein DRP87_03770 [Spirochaetes bacterium]|nr:MAG: hypothetical protein DRP87_03770 [Spirochaetota bacterium]
MGEIDFFSLGDIFFIGKKEIKMKRALIRSITFFYLLFFCFLPAFSQNEEKKIGNPFGLGIGLGAETFNEEEGTITWQSLSLTPELTLGKFGIGLDLTLHFRFTGGENKNEFDIREKDWIPESSTLKDILSVYLPKLRYVRYGYKGEPLFVMLGSIENATLGNGFIMGGYANTMFLPEKRLFGLSFDLDGRLFNFPYLGVETFIANLALFDLMGGRLYVRPLIGTEIPILKNLEVGGTVVGDRLPYYYVEDGDFDGDGEPDTGHALVAGGDVRLPLLNLPVFTLTTFADIAFEQAHVGGMLGLGGRLLKIIPYRGEIRLLGRNFIPVYFDSTYDLYRPLKHKILTGEGDIPGFVGWLFGTGISVLDDKLSLYASLDGPFKKPEPENLNNFNNYPHLQALFKLEEDLIPGFFFTLSYDKKFIRKFGDLIDPEGANVGVSLNIKNGPAVITLFYTLRYNPALKEIPRWETTSGLKSSLSLF